MISDFELDELFCRLRGQVEDIQAAARDVFACVNGLDEQRSVWVEEKHWQRNLEVENAALRSENINLRNALITAKKDFIWMLNNQDFLLLSDFDYIDAVLKTENDKGDT